MASRTINISLPEELVKEIDKAAKREYASRSDFIRQSVVSRIQARSNGLESLWDYVIENTDDTIAKNLGYSTNEDFARLAKEIRSKVHKKKQ